MKKMTLLTMFCCLLLGAFTGSIAQEPSTTISPQEQELLKLSKDKWQWMADKKVETLEELFHEKAVFVHMGGTMTRAQELATIKGGGIHYKKADIEKASVRLMGSTAIVLNTIKLLAVVGGNEVTNPFEVTEVYVQEKNTWKLAALTFTRLMR